ncbi:MAG: EamA family transporter [Steroidobacteraceae bacterium]
MLIPLLSVLAAMVSIQAGAALAKTLFAALTPEGTTALRLVFATAILFVVLRPWRDLAWLRRPGAFRGLLLYGASLGAMNLLFYISLRGLPLGIAVAIEFLGPLTVAVLSTRRAIDFAWIALAVAGMVLLLPWSASAAPLDPWALLAAFGAATAWALYIVFGHRLGKHTHGQAFSSVALGMGVASLVAAPVGVATAGPALLELHWWPAALGVALLSSAIPYPLEMSALQKLPARTFGILLSLEPVLAALAGFVILGERLTATQWFAIASIIIASAGAAASARREMQPDPV